MNANSHNDPDPPLRDALREWTVTEPLPPRFQEEVWRRIGRSESRPALTVPPWALLREWLDAMLPRPAFALACAVALLLAGGAAGWAQARHEAGHVGDELEARYLRVVDPYQPTD
jgi:hypothetical protein